ncbi:hypothetical protein B0H14DRAFT_1504469 [Mycena olivaceomarginata]|nr:hypothetical protein B0H14DRAFT_1504469 [Mycena olivaceomarginata]
MTMPTGIARCEGGTSKCAGCAGVAAGMGHRRSKCGERCTASPSSPNDVDVVGACVHLCSRPRVTEAYAEMQGHWRRVGPVGGGCEWKSRAKLRPGSRTIPRGRRLQWDMSRVHSTLLGGSLTGRTSAAEPNEDEDGETARMERREVEAGQYAQ